MHRLTTISFVAASLLVPALLLLRHQPSVPDRAAASPDPAALTPLADPGPPPAASPREDEVMAGEAPDPLYPELKLASLQQARDRDLPVRLPVPHRQTGQVERVNSYAAGQVSATGTLTGTHLRYRLSRLGHTISVELQDAATGRFQTWLSQPGRAPALMPVPPGEDLHLDCGAHESEPDAASGPQGFEASAAAAHPAAGDAAPYPPSSVQASAFAHPAADPPVIDVAIGWFPVILRGWLPEWLESRNRDASPAAVREYFLNRLYVSIDYANEVLENSAINVRFNPLVIEEIPDTEYIDTGNSRQIIGALRDPDDGKMDDFLRRAQAAGADFFTAIPGFELDFGGWAYINTSARLLARNPFSLVGVRNIIWGRGTCVHEWGHNLGCRHNRKDNDQQDADGFNFGWTFEELRHRAPAGATEEVIHGTVMAVGDEDTRPYFSNPESRYVHPISRVSHILGNARNDNRRVIRGIYQRAVDLNAVVPPAITGQPASSTVDEGTAASFSVRVSGSPPLTYQWRKNGSDILDATESIYAIARAGLADAGAYAVVVSNAAGRVTSSTVTLAVNTVAPRITSQPMAKDVVVGNVASFSVTASGTAPLTYQWRKNGASIATANAATYVIASAGLADAGAYSVVVSNAAGSVTSSVAILMVSQTAIAPVVTTPPAALSVGVGGTANFGVSVSGTSPFTYQWRKDGNDLLGGTAATYVIAGTQLTDAGAYSVVVSNAAGNVTSSAVILTVTESSVLSNLSVRTPLREAQVLVMGAVVSGGNKRLLIRAAGPALEALLIGLDGLPDPQITLYDSHSTPAVIGENDDWDIALADTFAAAGAFPFPVNSKDSAYLLEEARGAFTVHASGKDGTGIVLVEAYDRSAASAARLTNVSARHFAGAGDDTLIAGFVITGTGPSRVLIRAIGPTLSEPPYSVPGFLADPVMTVFNGDSDLIMSNHDWDAALTETFEAVGAFPLAEGSKDAALVLELDPGGYTVQVTGADEGTGIALIEIYVVDP